MSAPQQHGWRQALVCLALIGGTAILFSRSLGLGFINFDDPTFVINNPYVQRGLNAEGIRWAFVPGQDLWHPLTWISLMLDRALVPDGATVFHVTNVAWHALNAAWVFLIMRRITGAFWSAALSAALFAWHPLRVESVTWITERKDVLSGFFALAAVWFYLNYAEGGRTGRISLRRAANYAASLAAFTCGVLSKSVVVVLPVVLLLLDLWPLRRWAAAPAHPRGRLWDAGRLVGEKLPLFAISLVAGLLTVSTQEANGAFTLVLDFDQRAANALVSIVRYLGLFFWPFGLSALYPHPGEWPVLLVGAAGLLLAGVTALACWSCRERPWLPVGWGWFLAFLAPTLGLAQVGLQAMADRYTYLSILGVQLVVVEGAREWFGRAGRRTRIATTAAVLLVLAGLCARTWDQQRVWSDAETLFTHALAVTRHNFAAHTALALERLAQNRVDEADVEINRALAIAPESPLVLGGLASVQLAQGRPDAAAATYQRVLALQPQAVSPRCDLARILLHQGKVDEAEAQFAEAVRRRPASVPAHLGLADVALVRGRLGDALPELSRALDLAPRDPRIARRVAEVQIRLGRHDDAAKNLRLAASLRPMDAEVQKEVGDALGQIGRMEDAAAVYERAAAVAPKDAGIHVRLGYVYFLLKRPADAIRSWETARALDPHLTGLDQRIRQARAQIPP